MPRTKIVCTIGPAGDAEDTKRELIRAGMNLAGLNFSHGSRQEHLEKIHSPPDIGEQYFRHLQKESWGLEVEIYLVLTECSPD